MLQVLALASLGFVAVVTLDLWLWRSLLTAEQRHGEAMTLRFLVVVGARLLALVLVGSIAGAAMAEFGPITDRVASCCLSLAGTQASRGDGTARLVGAKHHPQLAQQRITDHWLVNGDVHTIFVDPLHDAFEVLEDRRYDIGAVRLVQTGMGLAQLSDDAQADQLASLCQTGVVVSHLRGSVDQLLKLLGHGLAYPLMLEKRGPGSFGGLRPGPLELVPV
jgi:hypothetical protein